MSRTALEDPLMVHMYNCVIDGFIRFNFSEITGLKKTTDVSEIREGGWNQTPRKSPGLSKYENVTFKRGQIVSGQGGGDDDFQIWLNQVHLTTRYGNENNFRRTATINQFAKTGVAACRWELQECWPAEDTPFTDLNGLTSDISFETFVVCHEGYTRIPVLAV